MYADNNGARLPYRGLGQCYPNYVFSDGHKNDAASFPRITDSYGASVDISHCPYDVGISDVQYKAWFEGNSIFNYAYLPELGGFGKLQMGNPPTYNHRLYKITDLMDYQGDMRILMADNNMWRVGGYSNPVTPYYTSHFEYGSQTLTETSMGSSSDVAYTHIAGIPEGSNIGYIDGHVGWIRWENMDHSKFVGYVYSSYFWELR